MTALDDDGALLEGNAIVSGGKLGGKGKVKGTTTQSDGSTLNPGASPGILAIDNQLVLADQAQLKLELNGLVAGSGHDQILASGTNQTVDFGQCQFADIDRRHLQRW